jgi:peptidoglycan/xylan/chitin deacetylase (PgdA/CDA1 family)
MIRRAANGSFPHGLMFHHFYNEDHPRGQGAISADDLHRIIDHYGADRIVSPEEWLHLFSRQELRDHHVCLTFDDALRCQIDIALPVLLERKVAAFWFVYSSVFCNKIESLELFRYFRTTKFSCFDEFCDAFVSEVKLERKLTFSPADVSAYLSEYPFYSYNDRLFRYLRDRILSKDEYYDVMMRMMGKTDFSLHSIYDLLWMKDADLVGLMKQSHVIGLHSYTHPIRIAELPEVEQRIEYKLNRAHIISATDNTPKSMSHPCNSYDERTLAILSDLEIDIGFCSNMSGGAAQSHLEFPREDHANIMASLA